MFSNKKPKNSFRIIEILKKVQVTYLVKHRNDFNQLDEISFDEKASHNLEE